MRVTFLGHAGMYVETEGGTVLCDPWFTPAYFGSWFPFPRNDRLDPTPFVAPGLPLHLAPPPRPFRPGVAARTTSTARPRCCCPASARPPRAAPAGSRLHRVRPHRARQAGRSSAGCEVAILAMTAPADGPAGRLRARPRRLDARRLLNQNDARPRDLARARGARSVRRTLHPVLRRDLVPDGLRLPGRGEAAPRRSASARTRWSGPIALRRATSARRHVFPVAGPPCFLDDDLFAFNDLDGDPANIFPDQTVVPRRAGARGHRWRGAAGARDGGDAHRRRVHDRPATQATRAGRDLRRQARGDLERYRDDWRDWLGARAGVVAARPGSTSWPRCASGWSRCSTWHR